MLVTQAEAKKTRCCRDMRDKCITADCMAWRWAGPPPAEQTQARWWPTTEDEATLRSDGGPDRNDPQQVNESHGGMPERVEWVPMEGTGKDAKNGFWQEPDNDFEARKERVANGRRGFCGLAGNAEY